LEDRSLHKKVKRLVVFTYYPQFLLFYLRYTNTTISKTRTQKTFMNSGTRKQKKQNLLLTLPRYQTPQIPSR